MTDQPGVTPDPADTDVDATPEDELPPLTDPSTIPADEGDAGNV